MPKGMPTALFIRSHLNAFGEDYPYHMFQMLESQRAEERQRQLTHKSYTQQKSLVGSYQNFRNYIWWLKKLNLIEPSGRVEKSTDTDLPQDRIYYRVVRSNLGKIYEWTNPRKALYPSTYHYKRAIK